MDLHIFPRNNDLGPQMPTFRERLNGIPSVMKEQGSAAPALHTDTPRPVTPHMLNNEEMEEALHQVEMQTAQQGQEALSAHAGLNEQRVARLLHLLD